MTPETSKIVSIGMKRVCSDFTKRVQDLGFEKSGRRSWRRVSDKNVDIIHFHRGGSSYGRPINNSIDIRIEISSQHLDELDEIAEIFISDQVRKRDGYAYHHRFNAKSWSTYDRCLDELELYIRDFAEPWFKAQHKKKLGGIWSKIVEFCKPTEP